MQPNASSHWWKPRLARAIFIISLTWKCWCWTPVQHFVWYSDEEKVQSETRNRQSHACDQILLTWNAKNLPITDSLLEKCVNAHLLTLCTPNVWETELAVEKARQEQWEDMLVVFKEVKRSDKRLVELEKSSFENDSKIKNVLEQKNKIIKI